MSDPAESLCGRADNVWPGRQCLTRHTASLAGQTHPAVRPSIRPNGVSEKMFPRRIHSNAAGLGCHRRRCRGRRGCVPGQTDGRLGVSDWPERLCARSDIVCPARHCLPAAREAVCRVRQCLPGETVSHPAHKVIKK